MSGHPSYRNQFLNEINVQAFRKLKEGIRDNKGERYLSNSSGNNQLFSPSHIKSTSNRTQEDNHGGGRKKIRGDNELKRPTKPFFVYMAEKLKLRKAGRYFSELTHREFIKQLSQDWNGMSIGSKTPYNRQFEKERDEYNIRKGLLDRHHSNNERGGHSSRSGAPRHIGGRRKGSRGGKRPLTAFMLFGVEARPSVREKFPHLGMCQIGKKLGELWNKLSEQEKQRYKDKANANRDDFNETNNPTKRRAPMRGVPRTVGEKAPLTPYFAFAKDHRAEIVKQYPTAPVTKIAQILGGMWKSLSESEKENYKYNAMKKREEFNQHLIDRGMKYTRRPPRRSNGEEHKSPIISEINGMEFCDLEESRSSSGDAYYNEQQKRRKIQHIGAEEKEQRENNRQMVLNFQSNVSSFLNDGESRGGRTGKRIHSDRNYEEPRVDSPGLSDNNSEGGDGDNPAFMDPDLGAGVNGEGVDSEIEFLKSGSPAPQVSDLEYAAGDGVLDDDLVDEEDDGFGGINVGHGDMDNMVMGNMDTDHIPNMDIDHIPNMDIDHIPDMDTDHIPNIPKKHRVEEDIEMVGEYQGNIPQVVIMGERDGEPLPKIIERVNVDKDDPINHTDVVVQNVEDGVMEIQNNIITNEGVQVIGETLNLDQPLHLVNGMDPEDGIDHEDGMDHVEEIYPPEDTKPVEEGGVQVLRELQNLEHYTQLDDTNDQNGDPELPQLEEIRDLHPLPDTNNINNSELDNNLPMVETDVPTPM